MDEVSPTISSKTLLTSMNSKAWSIAQQILDTILRYKSPIPKDNIDRSDEGAIKFLAIVYKAVKAQQPVRMVLPAFPFKSPNTQSKVLGTLPDKGEDVALARLNGMCAAIQEIYDPGARLIVVSDGVVYNGELRNSHHTV